MTPYFTLPWASLFGLAALSVPLFHTSAQAAVVYSNADVEATIKGGDANNGLAQFDGYFQAVDLATGEQTTQSIDALLVFPDNTTVVLSDGSTPGGLGTPVDMSGSAVSTAQTGNITVQASTTLTGRTLSTVFQIDSTGTLNGIRFVFYAENDLFFFPDDTASFTGTIAGQNLELYQYENDEGGLFIRLSGSGGTGASLSLFGSGYWSEFASAIESGNLSVLSSDGSNFQTASGDLGLALAFDLTGSSATVTVDYEVAPVTVPDNFDILSIDLDSTPGQAIVSWESSTGITYTLQQTSSLNPPNWTDVSPHIDLPGESGSMSVSSPVTAGSQFFRIQAGP